MDMIKKNKLFIPEKNLIHDQYIDELKIGIAVVNLTKDIAATWSQLVPDEQRSINKANLDKMSISLENGFWDESNGESVKFDTNGSLIDGQHRVLCVLKTGVPMKTLVVYGCPPKSIETIDTGKSRSLGDILKINGYGNSNQVASIVNNILNYKKYGTIQNSVCTSEALIFLRKNTSLVYRSCKTSKKAKPYLPMSITGFLHFYYSKVNSDGADQMFSEFTKPTGRCNSIEQLKNLIVRLRGASHKRGVATSGRWKMAICIKAFNAYFLGDNITTLRWTNQEKTPSIIDVWM